ncbi:tight junction-associated protein 1-like, partial [Anneissia japonica]|uniref:tight junction-associated protein 1-like n=1 Tax=Anneissia japonica TaxID=1529436 RepID=UPI001425ADF0
CRLEQSHRELHEVNSDLEERILDICAAYEKEKQALNREVVSISQKLLDAKFEINKLEEKNTRLRKDCEIATQLLQCTPSSSYAQHKISNLPHDVQYHVHKIMGEMAKSGDTSTLSPPSHNSPTATSNNPGYITVSNENNQPLLNSDSAISNGFLAGRVYDSVPAIVIAKAMQRRDEEERKEMEKLFPKMRRKKVELPSGEIHDKGTQTYQPYKGLSHGNSLLCEKCGESIAQKGNENTKPNEVNLLDLTESSFTEKVAAPTNGPSHSSLIADLLVEFEDQTKINVENEGSKPVESSVELLSILDTNLVSETDDQAAQPTPSGQLSKNEMDIFMDAEEEKIVLSRASSSTSLQSSASRSSEATSVQSLPSEPVSSRPQRPLSSSSLPGSPSRRANQHKSRSESNKQNGVQVKNTMAEKLNGTQQISTQNAGIKIVRSKANALSDSSQLGEDIPQTLKNNENGIVRKPEATAGVQRRKLIPESPAQDALEDVSIPQLEKSSVSVTPPQIFQQTSV